MTHVATSDEIGRALEKTLGRMRNKICELSLEATRGSVNVTTLVFVLADKIEYKGISIPNDGWSCGVAVSNPSGCSNNKGNHDPLRLTLRVTASCDK